MSRRDDIKSLITKYDRHVQKLKEQQASFGLHTPPHILTQIEDIEGELEKLQAELASAEDLDHPNQSTSSERLLVVRPFGHGEIVNWAAFHRGVFEPAESYFQITTTLTDAVSNMWVVCKELDQDVRRVVIRPNGFLSTYFKIKFWAESFTVVAVREISTRGKFPFSIIAADVPKNYNITFAIQANDKELLEHLIERFKELSPLIRIMQEYDKIGGLVQTTPMANQSLWFKWVLASIAGWTLGFVLVDLVIRNWINYNLMFGIVAGLIVGVMQGSVLRRIYDSWVLVTIAGWTLGWVISWFFGDLANQFPGSIAATVVTGAVIGGIIGIVQWLGLRPNVSRASWWILASSLGWGLAWTIGWMAKTFGLPLAEIIVIIITSAVYGAITGIVIVWLLRQPVPETSVLVENYR